MSQPHNVWVSKCLSVKLSKCQNVGVSKCPVCKMSGVEMSENPLGACKMAEGLGSSFLLPVEYRAGVSGATSRTEPRWDRWSNLSVRWIMWSSLYCQVSKS